MEIAARTFLAGEDAPWIQRERRLMKEIQVRAVERTVEAELRRGNADLAVQEAQLLLRLDPLDETGYRLLMVALAAQGNQAAEAPRVMTTCRDVLREQVDISPSAETERVFQEILAS
jgi:DNA-binding SARP family transcriptional activator